MKYLKPFKGNSEHISVRKLRNRFWIENLKQITGTSNIYQLKQYFEEHEDSFSNEKKLSQLKWYGYQSNTQRLTPKTIDFVEAKLRGSSVCFYHPLWDALELREFHRTTTTNLLKSLDHRVQAVICYHESWLGIGSFVPCSFSLDLISELLKIGSLDALTALFLYWFESAETDQKYTSLLAESIYSILLMIGVDLGIPELTEALFLIFCERVFKRTNWKNGIFAINQSMYLQDCQILKNILSNPLIQKKFQRKHDTRHKFTWRLLCNGEHLAIWRGFSVLILPNDSSAREKLKFWTENKAYLNSEYGSIIVGNIASKKIRN